MATTQKTAAAKSNNGGFREAIVTIIQVIFWVLVIRTFTYEPFNIPSGSMIPTLLVGDYVFVSKFSYGFSKYSFPLWNPPFHGRIFGSLPKRGDVVVFREPSDPSVDFIKRVVGLPGDKIQVKEGRLYINGDAVERKQIDDFQDDEYGEVEAVRQYLETFPEGQQHKILQKVDDGPLDNTEIYEVPADRIFCMGDNRDNSADSRVLNKVGYIPLENLIGRAQIRFYSFDPGTAWYEIWKWPQAIRYSRLMTVVR